MTEKESFAYRRSRNIARFIMQHYFTLSAQGIANIPLTGPVILAANHNSISDILVMGNLTDRPIHFCAKAEFWNAEKYFTESDDALKRALLYLPAQGWGAISRWYLKETRAISVHTGKSAMQFIKDCKAILQDDGVIGLYPEGKRGESTQLNPFSESAGFLSVLSGKNGPINTPIIPIGITNSAPPHFRGKHIGVVVGEAIKPETYTGTKKERVSAITQDLVARISQLTGYLAPEQGSTYVPAPYAFSMD